MNDNWPFADPANTACLTTRQVLEEGLPVLLVVHNTDGWWQFLCGTSGDDNDARVIGLGEALRLDPSLAEVAGLAEGGRAWRETRGGPWQQAPGAD